MEEGKESMAKGSDGIKDGKKRMEEENGIWKREPRAFIPRSLGRKRE
jgi:hypothetical protein